MAVVRATTITLLGETPAAHGVFDTREETQTTVFAEVMSVSQNEFYKAKQNGLEPELVFMLTDYGDYAGQKVFLYEQKRMRVIRTYIKEEALYIVAGWAAADSALPTPETPSDPVQPSDTTTEVETPENGEQNGTVNDDAG